MHFLCSKVFEPTRCILFGLDGIVSNMEDSYTNVLGSGNLDWRQIERILEDRLEVCIGQVFGIDAISRWIDHHAVAASILA